MLVCSSICGQGFVNRDQDLWSQVLQIQASFQNRFTFALSNAMTKPVAGLDRYKPNLPNSKPPDYLHVPGLPERWQPLN